MNIDDLGLVVDLRERLVDWQDADVAAYHLGAVLNLFPPTETADPLAHYREIKHVFWANNPLGYALEMFLRALVGAGVLETPTGDDAFDRYRWRAYNTQEATRNAGLQGWEVGQSLSSADAIRLLASQRDEARRAHVRLHAAWHADPLPLEQYTERLYPGQGARLFPGEPLASSMCVRDESTRARILGTLADGRTCTATQRNEALDGEWEDDRFGQAFDLSLDVVGPDVDREKVLAETRHSFWDGVERVEFIEPRESGLAAPHDAAAFYSTALPIPEGATVEHGSFVVERLHVGVDGASGKARATWTERLLLARYDVRAGDTVFQVGDGKQATLAHAFEALGDPPTICGVVEFVEPRPRLHVLHVLRPNGALDFFRVWGSTRVVVQREYSDAQLEKLRASLERTDAEGLARVADAVNAFEAQARLTDEQREALANRVVEEATRELQANTRPTGGDTNEDDQ